MGTAAVIDTHVAKRDPWCDLKVGLVVVMKWDESHVAHLGCRLVLGDGKSLLKPRRETRDVD